MTTAHLEKELLRYTRGLPKEKLEEIINFIKFIRRSKTGKQPADSIASELSLLNYSETDHLEEEFKDYRKLYPHE